MGDLASQQCNMHKGFPPFPRQTQALTSKTFKVPPLHLSLPQLYDWNYEHSPEHPVFEYLEDDGSITSLRYRDVIPAIHRGARIISSVLGTRIQDSKKQVVVAVLAVSGSLYDTRPT